ncbi:MAG TPA: hypothetical protein VJR92_11725 [Gemmatimonadaceae bacterium]|nr:hypothetical protein [Gemmatimonadaceae bacterium]
MTVAGYAALVRTRLWFWAKVVVALASILYGASIVYAHFAYRTVVRNMLSIERLPESVRVGGCSSAMERNVKMTCSISLEPRDSTALLAGFDFARATASGLSTAQIPDHPGKAFEVGAIYKVGMPAFANAGHILVIVDASWRRGLVNLQLE